MIKEAEVQNAYLLGRQAAMEKLANEYGGMSHPEGGEEGAMSEPAGYEYGTSMPDGTVDDGRNARPLTN
jgi:hypothetical protein